MTTFKGQRSHMPLISRNTEAPKEENSIELPLVSVIIINYNYGRFLQQTVASVFAQTYPHIECILVDNASTDESDQIIAALETAHETIKVIRRPTNDGQT